MQGKTQKQDEDFGQSKGFGNTSGGFGSNPASLKGKLMSLEVIYD
jgi:hypothetical protein